MDPKKFLKKITCEYDAKVPLHNPDISNYFDSRAEAVEYFRKYPEYFAIFEDDEGNPLIVGARLKEMRLCIGYSVRRRGYRCFDPDCQAFHLCRDFVGGYCNNGLNCDMCHSLNTDSNMKVLRRLGLLDTYPPYPEEKLLALLRMSLPQICGLYNRDLGCPNGNACTRFHLCKLNIIKVCENPMCPRAHDLTSAHTKRLLKIYNLEGKTLEEIKDSLLIHKVMPKSDVEISQLQRAAFLDQLRWKPIIRTMEAGTAAADEPAMDQDEIEQIQTALGEIDLSEFFINQQLVESQVELLPKKKEGESKTQNEPEAKRLERVMERRDTGGGLSSLFRKISIPVKTDVYLCEAFINGNCSQANCKDVHFPSRFLWQVQIRGQWYDMQSVNDELEEAYNRRDRDYTTQVPLESKHEPGELMLIKFRPVIKGCILHTKENVNIRRLQVRPVTHLPINLLAPTVISGKQETAKEETVVRGCMSTDKPENKEASKRPVCWQILMEEEWIPLAEANDEIEKAYQSQEDEYITQVPGQHDATLIAIHFKDNVAISICSPTEFEVRRLVNDDEATKAMVAKQQAETKQQDDSDSEIDIEDESTDDVKETPQTSEWQWQWRNEQLEWVPYHEAISAALEKQYAKRKSTCSMRVDGEMWTVDYLAETQENLDTQEIRHIRRVNI